MYLKWLQMILPGLFEFSKPDIFSQTTKRDKKKVYDVELCLCVCGSVDSHESTHTHMHALIVAECSRCCAF